MKKAPIALMQTTLEKCGDCEKCGIRKMYARLRLNLAMERFLNARSRQEKGQAARWVVAWNAQLVQLASNSLRHEEKLSTHRFEL